MSATRKTPGKEPAKPARKTAVKGKAVVKKIQKAVAGGASVLLRRFTCGVEEWERISTEYIQTLAAKKPGTLEHEEVWGRKITQDEYEVEVWKETYELYDKSKLLKLR